MNEDIKNKALLKTLTLGMILAGPLAITGGATAYAQSSATTYGQQATGEAESAVKSKAKAAAEGSSYTKAKGEAEGSAHKASGEAEGSSYTKAKGEAEGSAHKASGEAEGSSYTKASGEAEGSYYGAGEAEAPSQLPTNCPPGTTPQNNGTCLLN